MYTYYFGAAALLAFQTATIIGCGGPQFYSNNCSADPKMLVVENTKTTVELTTIFPGQKKSFNEENDTIVKLPGSKKE